MESHAPSVDARSTPPKSGRAMTKKKPDKIRWSLFEAQRARDESRRAISGAPPFADFGKQPLIDEWLAAFRDNSLELRKTRRDLRRCHGRAGRCAHPGPEHS